MLEVLVFANGGDNRANCVANGLGHALYACADHAYRKVTDAELQDEKLSLEPDNEEQTLSYQEQRDIVEKMLGFVANDYSIDASKRPISLGRKVFNCKCEKGGPYTKFAERFRGVTQKHLNCFQHRPTDEKK